MRRRGGGEIVRDPPLGLGSIRGREKERKTDRKTSKGKEREEGLDSETSKIHAREQDGERSDLGTWKIRD